MNLVTNKDLHYLITQHIDVKNGIEWYKAVKRFAQGERSNESGLLRELLDDLKLPSSKSIKESIAAFEEAVTRVNNVNLTCMTESEKLYLLTRKLKGDKQEGMEAILYTFLCDDYFVAVELGRFMSITIRIIFIGWNGDPLFLSESKELALVQEKPQAL